MSEEFVCGYCGMDLESPGEFHDIGSCAKYLRETRVKMRNEINAFQSRIAELEKYISQLVEVGGLLAECSEYEGGKIAWDELVYYWKEG